MVEVESCQAQSLGRRKRRLLRLVFETKMPLPIQAYAKHLPRFRRKHYERDKRAFAERILPLITKEGMAATFDLKTRLDEVCNAIKK
jgi:hypothetical protein